MKAIARGEVVRLTNQDATEIEVRDGSIWVTQDRDGQDYILTKGNSFRIKRAGVTVISALKAALIDIRRLAPAS